MDSCLSSGYSRKCSDSNVPTKIISFWDGDEHCNGTIWFTERAGNKIGKLVPGTGAITEYNVPTANSQPSGLAIYGGIAFFAEAQGNRLGRVTLGSGAIVETLLIDTPNCLPEDVTINLWGRAWVTEMQGNKIALNYWTTLTDFLQFTVPTPNSEPYGITMASDGATVWFTERAGNKIGRFDGSFAEFPLPTPASSPTGVVLDSVGCVWYAAPTANQIGRFCPVRVFLPVILKNW